MTEPLFDLTGKVAVVSGAAQGMGRATAIAVAQQGADVVLVDRNTEGAEATALVTGIRDKEAWPTGYAGQRFPLQEMCPEQELSGRERLRGFVYRDPVGSERTREMALWVRLSGVGDES